MGCSQSTAAVQQVPDQNQVSLGEGTGFVSRLRSSLHRKAGYRSGGSSKASLSRLDQTGDTEDYLAWEAKATALAASTIPFVPSRLAIAFSSGLLSGFASGHDDRPGGSKCASRSPSPRAAIRAALLVVDVSGFSALIEDARRRHGSADFERLSLDMTDFFTGMLEIVSEFHGDVECFGAESSRLTILFEPRDGDGGSGDDDALLSHDRVPGQAGDGGSSSISRLAGAARRALACARAVHRQLNGFRRRPDDPPLGVHSALAAGDFISVECGGQLANRSEAFVVGSPFLEIGEVLGGTQRNQMVLAPSAVGLVGQWVGLEWSKESLSDGSLLLTPLPEDCSPLSSTNPPTKANNSSASRISLDASPESVLSLAPVSSSTETHYHNSICPLQSVVAQMHCLEGAKAEAAGPGIMSSRGSTAEAGSTTFRQLAMDRAGEQETLGIDALLRFMPAVAREGCLGGLEAKPFLMEDRMVAILSVTADMKEHEGRYTDSCWVASLEGALSSSIDMVEAQLGGSTQQIAMDGRGLAMVFVFGLPGYLGDSQTVPALLSAQRVLSLLNEAGISATAGVSTGWCSCGLVGDPKRRCEYAVMGECVGIGARLAVAAGQQGADILCTDDVRRASPTVLLQRHGLTLQPAGSVKLNGGAEEVHVYRPETPFPSPVSHRHKPAHATELLGRDVETGLLHLAVSESLGGGNVGLSLVLIEGAEGVGKSCLVKSLMHCGNPQPGPSTETSPAKWILIRAAQDDCGTPLMPCRSILRKLLDLRPDEADRMSWLLGDFELGSNLPGVLRPYAEALRNLRESQADKTTALESLYAAVIHDALLQTSVVLILEDVHNLDQSSQRVLGQIASQLGSGAGAQCRPRGGSIVICTSRTPLELPANCQLQQLPSATPGPGSPIGLLKLEPLCMDTAVEVARSARGWETLPDDVEPIVAGYAMGIPLHAIDLLEWLRHEGYVGAGGHSVGRAKPSSTLQELMLPSRQAMMLAQIEHLPTALRAVLRCACVLGSPFTSSRLLALLPDELAGTEKQLEPMLDMLHSQQLIEPTEAQLIHSSSRFAHVESSWQMCRAELQRVVYDTMADTLRRVLHKEASKVLHRQLSKGLSKMQARPVLKGLTRHLLAALSAAQPGSLEMTPGESWTAEVRLVAVTLERAAENSMSVGDFREAHTFRNKRLELLKQQNQATEHKVLRLLEAEAEAVEDMHKCHMLIRMWDPELHGEIYTETCAKTSGSRQEVTMASVQSEYQEFLDHQAEIQKRIAALSAPQQLRRMSSQSFRSFRKKRPKLPLMRRLAILKFLAPSAVEFVASNGFLKPQTMASLRERVYKPGTGAVERAFLIAHMAFACITFSTCWVCLETGNTFSQSFSDGGKPFDLMDMGGEPICSAGNICWLLGQVGIGQIDGSAVASTREALAAVDNIYWGLILAWWGCIEASWEPLWSRRVLTLEQDRKSCGKLSDPAERLSKCLDGLRGAWEATEALLPYLREGISGEEDRRSCEVWMAAFDHSLAKAVRGAKAAVGAADHIGQAAVVRACVAEGCRVLFRDTWAELPSSSCAPAIGDASGPGEVALEYLATVCSHLSAAVDSWGQTSLNVFGEQSFLPSTAIWGKAMLQLFRWALDSSGHRSMAPQAPQAHFLHGIGGICHPAPSQLRPGAPATISALLVAQRVAAVRGEVTFGLLPATVALARLLVAHGTCAPLRAHCMATSVYLPVAPPVAAPPEAGEGPHEVSVEHISLGTRRAWEVAAVHLQSVVHSVSVAGTPVSLARVNKQKDVGGSESLWEAAQLWKRIKRQLQSHP